MNCGVKAEKIIWKYLSSFDLVNKNNTNLFLLDVNEQYLRIENNYEKCLSADEIYKADKYFKLEDKKRYVVGKYFTKYIISKFTKLAQLQINFTKGNFNKPKSDYLEFNISHSGNLLVIATDLQHIGVDIEEIKKDFDFRQLMPTTFTSAEIDFINSDENISEMYFYILWCRKEALLKATGEGLIDNLTEIDVLNCRLYRADIEYNLISFEIGNNYALGLAMAKKNKIEFWKF